MAAALGYYLAINSMPLMPGILWSMTFVKASYGHLARRSAATLIEPIAHHLLMAIRLA
jgi:hypothetical protein